MKLTDDQCAEIRGQLCEMDNAARRKRAERLRRKEAGEVRCELWISPHEVETIKQKHGNAMWTPSDCVRFAVAWCVRMK